VRKRKEVCKHWMLGKCMLDDRCPFMHKLDPKRVPVCEFFLRGECAHGAQCRFRHDNLTREQEQHMKEEQQQAKQQQAKQQQQQQHREQGDDQEFCLNFGDSDSDDSDSS
jgi:hypothetical protein